MLLRLSAEWQRVKEPKLPTTKENQRIKEDPVYFITEWLGMQLHPGQIRYLNEAKKAVTNPGGSRIRRFLLSCANRYGKSALISCIQLWYLYNKFGINAATDQEWFKTEYRTANIAPTSKLTQPVFKAMKAIMTSAYPIQDPQTGLITNNKCKIEWFLDDARTINNPPFKLFFVNNSYIEHLSLMGNKGDSLQGLPYGIITYDEAPRSDWLQVEIDDGILGRLMDWIAPLHLLGTPSQVSNNASLLYYHDMYQEGLFGFNSSYTQEGSLYDNTFLTEEQIREQVKMVEHSPYKDQILEGKFIFGVKNVFNPEDIEAIQDESLNDGVNYMEGHKYVIGVDTAMGNDEFVISILDITEEPWQLVWQDAAKGNERSPQMHLNALVNLIEAYRHDNNMQMLLETWNGESARFFLDLPLYVKSFTQCYGAWQPERVKTDNDNPLPKRTSLIQKADLIVNLNKALSERKIRIPKHNNDLIRQLSIYRENDKNLPTDRLMSLALAAWLAENSVRQQLIEFHQFTAW